jgi:hypothetical protein
MPGFGATQQAYQVRSGNSAAIMIGDIVVMYAQTADSQMPMGAEQLYGIGSNLPQEVQQFKMSPQFALTAFALTAAGLATFQGGTSILSLLVGNAFDVHILGNEGGSTNKLLYTFVGAKSSVYGQSIGANTPTRDSYTFLAMDVQDPSGNSIMAGPNNAIDVVAEAVSIAAAAASNLGNVTG